MRFEGRDPDLQVINFNAFEGRFEYDLGRTHPSTRRSLGVLHDRAEGLDGFPRGTLHTRDGMLHQRTAGVAVGSLETILLEPTAEGAFGHITLLCRCGDRWAGDQCCNNLVLFAAEFFAMADHLRSPAIIWVWSPLRVYWRRV